MERLMILDRDLMGRILKKGLVPKFGAQTPAARAIGVPQPTLNRLLNGKTASIKRPVFESLRDVLRDDPWGVRLLYAVLTYDGAGVYEDYYSWLQARLSVFDIVVPHVATGRPFPPPSERTLREYERTFTSGHAEVIRNLREIHPSPFNRFERFVTERGFDVHEPRIQFAVLRVISPLFDSMITQGVERGLEELESGGDLGPFLEASFKRERLMLKREPDLERVTRIAAKNQ